MSVQQKAHRQALVLRRDERGFRAAVEELVDPSPNEGDVTVAVHYSSLNYKDALAVTDRGKIVRADYPFVPGIDIAGRVVASDSDDWRVNDMVVATGCGIGESHWGGYSERQRLRSEWLVPLPSGMSARQAMAVGTAGFTAMLAVLRLEAEGVTPEDGEVVVTGASGGVGSFATHLLAQRGYSVVASSGKDGAQDYLSTLGATRVMGRQVLSEGARRALDRGIWSGAVDSVGGATLSALLSQTKVHGCVAACGLAGGAELETTVFPFILRGVCLAGIDSNTCPIDLRKNAWQCLSREVSHSILEKISATIPLTEVPAASARLLDGKVTGRLVVQVGGD